ncbi:hypothetical protein N2152v2_000780 [Parachlorella kessleri]
MLSAAGGISAAVNIVLSRRWDALLDRISRTSTTSSEGPWKTKAWGTAQSLEALKVLSGTLGMTVFEFADTLGGRPSIYTKPAAVIKANAEDLAEQLGQQAALQLIKEVPGALARGAWPSNVAYLQSQLGLSVDEAQRLVLTYGVLKSASGCLAGPMMQYILQLCQEHLALDPTAVLLRHSELLRSPPQKAALRVTFIGRSNLAARIRRKVFAPESSASSAPAKISEISTSFMKDTEPGW